MPKPADEIYNIRQIVNVRSEVDGVSLSFAGGMTATLCSDHPDYEILLQDVHYVHRSRRFAGFIIDGSLSERLIVV